MTFRSRIFESWGQNVLGHPVGEEGVLGIGAQVLKGKHRNRLAVGGGSARPEALVAPRPQQEHGEHRDERNESRSRPQERRSPGHSRQGEPRLARRSGKVECQVMGGVEALLGLLLETVADDALERGRDVPLRGQVSEGSSLRIADIVSAAESRRKARLPESISKRIAPKEKMSDLTSVGLPRTCSGAM